MEITKASHELFMRLAADAGNWSGMPPTSGNVGATPAERGNLTQLKQAELLTTEKIDGYTWVLFTRKGRAYAAEHGVTVEPDPYAGFRS